MAWMIWAERHSRLNAGPRITAHWAGRIWITVIIESNGCLFGVEVFDIDVEADSCHDIIKGKGLALLHTDVVGQGFKATIVLGGIEFVGLVNLVQPLNCAGAGDDEHVS